jgi:3D (Asp-Asp-Asp) domain-containing protein
MIEKFMLRLAGLVVGCAIAVIGAPIMCLADTNGNIVSTAETNAEFVSEDVTVPAGHWVDIGNYKLTFFCNCRKCCGKWAGGPTASGTMPAEGRTVACGSLPLGTRILIAGQGEFIVEDRGVSGRHIDIYMDSHSACLKKGVQRGEVFRWVKD